MLVKKKGQTGGLGVLMQTASVLFGLCINYASLEVRTQDGSHFKFVTKIMRRHKFTTIKCAN